MDITVKSKYLKSSPLKIRPLLWNLRGQNPFEAMTRISFVHKKGGRFAVDILKSALAAAKENDLEVEKLSIKSIFCGEGPRLKRRQIGSRGRSDPILKRMCHLTLTITDDQPKIKEAKEDAKKVEKVKKSETKVEKSKSEKENQ